jgi:hypothetical protein
MATGGRLVAQVSYVIVGHRRAIVQGKMLGTASNT